MSKREYTYKGGKRPSMRKKGELAILKSQYKQSQKELRKQEISLIKNINTLCDEIEANQIPPPEFIQDPEWSDEYK